MKAQKTLTLNKTGFQNLVRSCKFNDKVYLKLTDDQLFLRCIDFKSGLGLLDQKIKLVQPVSFKTPYYFSINTELLLKALRTIRAEVVELFLNQADNTYNIKYPSENKSITSHSFCDVFQPNSTESKSRIEKPLVSKSTLLFSLVLPVEVITEIFDAAESVESTVSFVLGRSLLKVRSSRVDGKAFNMEFQTSADIDSEMSKRVNFGKFAKAMVLTPGVDLYKLDFHTSFLVISVEEQASAKSLYLPYKR